MAAEPFNSIGGYTVGIPPVPIVDANGNVTTNVNAPAANVTANRVFANYYLYANGYSIITEPGGSNTAIQFNNNGIFGGSNALSFNNVTNTLSATNFVVSGNANLGNVSTLTILGGDNGYFLQTDGTGNLTWAPGGNGGNGNGSPGGANTQVQYNDSGNFGGDPGFTYNELTNTLTVGYITVDTITGNLNGHASSATVANTVSNAAQPNITSLGNLLSLNVSGNILSNNITANSNIGAQFVNVSNTLYTYDISATGYASLTTANVSANLSTGNANLGNLATANFVNVTNTLTATTANVIGQFNGNVLSISNSISTTNLTVSVNASISGLLNQTGNANFANSANVNLGNIENLHISGGINGYVLATNGAGNLYWTAGGGGGNGTPGGSNTQVQYNDSGTFGGSAFFTFNENTNNVQIAGNLISNAITIGSGIYQFSYSNVYFATTSSTSPNQVLLSIEADNGVGGGNIAAVDYTIISTDDNIRNFIKISCVRIGNSLNYVEYSTLPINGYTGDFQVQYNAGNVISPATIQLILTPQSANLMTHKMMITAYYD
jgi:hypothetical protein